MTVIMMMTMMTRMMKMMTMMMMMMITGKITRMMVLALAVLVMM